MSRLCACSGVGSPTRWYCGEQSQDTAQRQHRLRPQAALHRLRRYSWCAPASSTMSHVAWALEMYINPTCTNSCLGNESLHAGAITKVAIQCAPSSAAVSTLLLAMTSFPAIHEIYSLANKHLAEILSAFEFFDGQSMDLAMQHIPGAQDPFNQRWPIYVLVETSGVPQQAWLTGRGRDTVPTWSEQSQSSFRLRWSINSMYAIWYLFSYTICTYFSVVTRPGHLCCQAIMLPGECHASCVMYALSTCPWIGMLTYPWTFP